MVHIPHIRKHGALLYYSCYMYVMYISMLLGITIVHEEEEEDA